MMDADDPLDLDKPVGDQRDCGYCGFCSRDMTRRELNKLWEEIEQANRPRRRDNNLPKR